MSGRRRVKVYAGTDPLTGRETWFRKTCETKRARQMELDKLPAMARAAARRGRHRSPAARSVRVNTRVDVSSGRATSALSRPDHRTRLGSTQVRKVRGPLLDTLYARLMRARTSRARRTTHRASQYHGSQARPSRTATGAFRRMSGSGASPPQTA